MVRNVTNIVVRYLEGDRLTAAVRGHEVTVDQPVEDGGDDLAPTPTELFVSGLAACVGFFAERYLRRHDLDPSGLAVECDYDYSAEGLARVGEIRVSVMAPGLPDARREPFARVIERCTVHNSLVRPPTVTIDLARSAKAA